MHVLEPSSVPDRLFTKTISLYFRFHFLYDFNSKSFHWMDEYPSAPLKMILHADWDVLSALHKALTWFPIKPTIHHVRSHQDDNPTKTALTLPEQLNVDADTLATTALCVLDPKPHVPFNLDTQIQLDYRGCTITRNLKPTLREKLQLPALQRYYEDWMQWSSTTFDVIDWDIFRPVYRKQAKKNLQWINKFCL